MSVCPQCGRTLSQEERVCPDCAVRRVAAKYRPYWVFVIAALLIVIVVLVCMLHEKNRENREEQKNTHEIVQEEQAQIEPTQEKRVENMVETSTETPVQEQAVPYLETVSRSDQMIFTGPSYDEACVGTVQIAGVYTIVEESRDREGNLWGKLKSGVGWIDLTQVRTVTSETVPVSVAYAEDVDLTQGYREYVFDRSEYSVGAAMQSYERLSDAKFWTMTLTDDGMQIQNELCHIGEWLPGEKIVMQVSFPGDFSSYGLTFVDEQGQQRCFILTMSLRNGTLELTEEE